MRNSLGNKIGTMTHTHSKESLGEGHCSTIITPHPVEVKQISERLHLDKRNPTHIGEKAYTTSNGFYQQQKIIYKLDDIVVIYSFVICSS